MAGLNNSNLQAIAIITLTICCVSLVSLMLMAASLIYFGKRDCFRVRLTACLCISIFMYTFPALISVSFYIANGDSKNSIPRGVCQWQGFTLQWFSVATDMWTGVTAVYVYLRVVHQKHLDDYQGYVIAFVTIIPFAIALLPFFGIAGGYGVVSAWCWIMDRQVRIYFFYLPVWINFALMAILYSLVFYHLIKVRRAAAKMGEGLEIQQKYNMNKQVIQKFVGYAVAFVIVWLPATVNRVQNLISPNPILWLNIAQALTGFSAGLLYFIAYGIYNEKMISWLRNVCCLCKHNEDDTAVEKDPSQRKL